MMYRIFVALNCFFGAESMERTDDSENSIVTVGRGCGPVGTRYDGRPSPGNAKDVSDCQMLDKEKKG